MRTDLLAKQILGRLNSLDKDTDKINLIENYLDMIIRDGFKPSVLSELLDGTVKQLKTDCFKALTCLYIAVDASVADGVNSKVKAYITALENYHGMSAV
jgi:hypothetical protein